MPHPVVAEVIAIGDELTSGFRLDTNTQWLSRQLEELGLHVGFHSTVGDDLASIEQVIDVARNRADVIVATGGLGPTADDLTRHGIKNVANVELQPDLNILQHIEKMFASRGREMPSNNRIQAMFPAGAIIVPNPEGTAPGIEFRFSRNPAEGHCTMFALPGVPAEMKQMWQQSVEPRLRQSFDLKLTTHHHLLHCFGTGESAIETMLSNMIERGRDPLVGITASAATISLRLSTKAESVEACQLKMEATLVEIKQTLGDLVYGENGQQLEDAVVQKQRAKNQTVYIVDDGLHGEVARRLSMADPDRTIFAGGTIGHQNQSIEERLKPFLPLDQQTMLVGIGPIDRHEETVKAGESYFDVAVYSLHDFARHNLRYSGHSSWREERAVKDVLNLIRLHD